MQFRSMSQNCIFEKFMTPKVGVPRVSVKSSLPHGRGKLPSDATCWLTESRDLAAIAGQATEGQTGGSRVLLHNTERRSWLQPWKAATQGLRDPVCCMTLPPRRRRGAWHGPRIRLCLPSFSGGTPECPQLLQYTCKLMTNVRAVPAAKVQVCQALSPSNALTFSLHSLSLVPLPRFLPC
jgi:hypothetical protein